MPSADFRPEVEQRVAGIDLAASQREGVASRKVDSGLAGDCDAETGLGDEAALALAEKTGGVAERFDGPAQTRFEIGLRLADLVPEIGRAHV